MTKAVFITATGTDVGKTYISGLIVKKMRDFGLNCGYYKPALSGALRSGDKLIPGDAQYVIETSGLNIPPEKCITYCFEEAVSPHLAAIRQGVNIELQPIKNHFKNLCQNFDYIAAEGAGGITCPFNLNGEQLLLPDIIMSLGLDIIIVADGGLGTINSVLLTVEYAKTRNIGIQGIILNNYDETNFMHIDNKNQIENLTGIKVLAVVKQNDDNLEISKDELIKVFNKEV